MSLRDRLRRLEEAATHLAAARVSGEPPCPGCLWPLRAVAHAIIEDIAQLGICPDCGRWLSADGRPLASEKATFELDGRTCMAPPQFTAEDCAIAARITRQRGIGLQPGPEETTVAG